jgi:acyl dehydratase
MGIEYFEDIKLHQKYRSPGYRLKEKEIIAYAKRWDPNPFHVDPELAKNTSHGGLIASGNHIEAISVKLSHQRRPKIAWIAIMGLDKLRFVAPARPGDVLVLENEVIWKRKSKSDPNRGIIRYVSRLLNQRDEIVFSNVATALVARRPAKGAAPIDLR